MRPDSSVMHGDRTRGKSHKLKHRKFCTRGCAVSFSGDVQDLPGHLPVKPGLGSLLLQGGCIRWSLEIPSSPYNSVIL